MMKEEFESRTGVFLPDYMYSIVEEFYIELDKDKDEFCKMYKNNIDGIAEKIQRKSNETYFLKETAVQKVRQKDLATIARLEKELYYEQEWEPHPNNKMCSQRYYNNMLHCSGVKEMSVEEARKFVSDSFGFKLEFVKVELNYQQCEINRHNKVRKSKSLPVLWRHPLYDSTDHNYVLFSCCGYNYECIDGELYVID